jgi:hypothetical protein
VTNAGSNGKFLGVLDFDVKGGKVADFRYKLLPVFANMLPADPEMDALIDKVRAPYEAKLAEKLAVTEGLLYRRGNFNGSWDQLMLDALMDVQGAEIAFSPGFRWGTSLLPGEAITREHLMDQTAITYPYATLTEMSGETIKTVLEDVADNLFNPDPYYQQGGDMVRVGGLTATSAPAGPTWTRSSAPSATRFPNWSPAFYGFSDADQETVFNTSNTFFGKETMTLRELLNALRETYCGTIGAEYMYITDQTPKRWWQQKLESIRSKPSFTPRRSCTSSTA